MRDRENSKMIFQVVNNKTNTNIKKRTIRKQSLGKEVGRYFKIMDLLLDLRVLM